MCATLLAFLLTLETTTTDGKKTIETEEVAENGGVATFRLTREQILGRKAKSLALIPEFARACKGEEGYWVVSTGQLGSFRCDDGRFVCAWPSMSMFGMKTPRRTFVAIVKGLKYYFPLPSHV